MSCKFFYIFIIDLLYVHVFLKDYPLNSIQFLSIFYPRAETVIFEVDHPHPNMVAHALLLVRLQQY